MVEKTEEKDVLREAEMSCDDDPTIEQELALISSRQEGDETQTQKNVQDCCCRLVALASAGKPTTGASPASTTSTTPQLSGAENDDEIKTHPAFHISYLHRPEDIVYSQSLSHRRSVLAGGAFESFHRDSSVFCLSTKESTAAQLHQQLAIIGSSESDSEKLSRSISDSTLRRAALSLNLSQAVLPSFTSIQQFKVISFHLQLLLRPHYQTSL